MEFKLPIFEPGSLFFTAVGVVCLWAKLAIEERRAVGLSDLLEHTELSMKTKLIIEFFVFVSLGCIIGVAVVQPVNAQQALAAGLGWTGLLTSERKKTRKSK